MDEWCCNPRCYATGPAKGPADDEDSLEAITVQGALLRPNLIRALTQLRDWGADDYYRIDSVCINQSDPRELSDQVSNMDKIYAQVVAVDVWLGRSNQDTSKVLEILGNMQQMNSMFGNLFTLGLTTRVRTRLNGAPKVSIASQLMPERDWTVLTSFFARRWFHRLWTLQEFALAKESRIICGK